MKRRILTVLTVALSTCGVLGLASASTREADPKTIKEIMTALNKGPNAETGKMKKAIAANDWDKIQASAKKFDELAPDLGKNDPPKGDKENWKKLTDKYTEDAKSLKDAADKKDAAGTKTAFQKLSTSCMQCHQAHRGK